jgi:hypothetical protein
MSKPYGTTIFCDDIRDETTGKKTYVGVYPQDMVVSGPFPALIPQFALAVTYLEPLSMEISPVTIKIFVPSEDGKGQLAAEIDLPLSRESEQYNKDHDPLAQFRATLMAFKISPLVVVKEGYIKVRAYFGEEEIRLGSMRIRLPHDREKVVFP